jgi:hypothetical protein
VIAERIGWQRSIRVLRDRVAHFDPPPPEVLGDLDELQEHDRFRFANRLDAWIQVQDGRIVEAGQRGGGRSNVTKVGYGSASIAFALVAMPDLRPEPEVGPSWTRFVQTAGGGTGFPTPAGSASSRTCRSRRRSPGPPWP